jgi:hypothetical protein
MNWRNTDSRRGGALLPLFSSPARRRQIDGVVEDAAWTVESRFDGEKWLVKATPRRDVSDADLDAVEGV